MVAYENEPQALILLRRNMARYSNVEIVAQDFLRAELPREPYKVFANIPFSLSSKIVAKLAFADTPPRAMYLIVQKQFAQKLVLDSAHFHGALGQALAPWWAVRIRRPLRRSDFTPPPAVDTVLLELKLRAEPLLDPALARNFSAFVYNCYHDRLCLLPRPAGISAGLSRRFKALAAKYSAMAGVLFGLCAVRAS